MAYAKERGQGLVEYALILVLVSVVSIFILGMTGGGIRSVFCDIMTQMQQGEVHELCIPADDGDIQITDANYNSNQERLRLKATYLGGFDPLVTLTASPGGVMTQLGNQYFIEVNGLTGCPCEIVITSSEGDRTTTTIE